MLFVLVHGNEDDAVFGHQLPKQLQPRPHHAEPLVVPFQVFVVDRGLLLQPLSHGGTVDVVVVYPAFVSRIVRRIDVDDVHAIRVSRHQRLQSVKVVAVDDQVFAVVGGSPREIAMRNERLEGDGQVMSVDVVLALEIQERHDASVLESGSADQAAGLLVPEDRPMPASPQAGARPLQGASGPARPALAKPSRQPYCEAKPTARLPAQPKSSCAQVEPPAHATRNTEDSS